MFRSLSTQKIVTSLIALISVSQVGNPMAIQALEPVPKVPNDSQSELEETQLSLYGGPRTRASIVQWYLAELDVSYQYISLDIQAQEHQQPDYLDINPMGKVPAIVDGGFKLWESGAILLYLADKQGKLPDSIEGRAEMNQWVIFANATLGPGLFLEDRRDREMPKLLTPINQLLEKQSFIVGSELSVADIAVGSYLYYAQTLLSLDFSDYPAVETYLNQLSKRPAFLQTLGQR